ncbi:hypothetical protein L596_010555 [Steinernema carpocapsae]|uniref:Uncharacterized protein n=1 Tax=Steinernema carpocapsae TaxID=34508 RepID=A0A4U5PK20_STECR|nr:hypothetical protein L596_010555 [Steinernema carpocapsae]
MATLKWLVLFLLLVTPCSTYPAKNSTKAPDRKHETGRDLNNKMKNQGKTDATGDGKTGTGGSGKPTTQVVPGKKVTGSRGAGVEEKKPTESPKPKPTTTTSTSSTTSTTSTTTTTSSTTSTTSTTTTSTTATTTTTTSSTGRKFLNSTWTTNALTKKPSRAWTRKPSRAYLSTTTVPATKKISTTQDSGDLVTVQEDPEVPASTTLPPTTNARTTKPSTTSEAATTPSTTTDAVVTVTDTSTSSSTTKETTTKGTTKRTTTIVKSTTKAPGPAPGPAPDPGTGPGDLPVVPGPPGAEGTEKPPRTTTPEETNVVAIVVPIVVIILIIAIIVAIVLLVRLRSKKQREDDENPQSPAPIFAGPVPPAYSRVPSPARTGDQNQDQKKFAAGENAPFHMPVTAFKHMGPVKLQKNPAGIQKHIFGDVPDEEALSDLEVHFDMENNLVFDIGSEVEEIYDGDNLQPKKPPKIIPKHIKKVI